MADEIPEAGFIGPESERKPIQLDRLFVAPKTEEVEPPFVAPEQDRKTASTKVAPASAKLASTDAVGKKSAFLYDPYADQITPLTREDSDQLVDAAKYVFNTAPKPIRDLSQKAQKEYNRQVIASAERARTGAVEEDIPIMTDPMMGVSFPMSRENLAGIAAVAGSAAEQVLTFGNVAAMGASGGLGTVARYVPKLLPAARGTAGVLNTMATAPAIGGAVEAAGASFENPTPQNIGAFFGNALIAALGGLGIARDLTFRVPAKFDSAASAAANKAAQTAEQATARQALEAAQIAQEQNNIRAADFLKAKAELHQQAAADLEAALKGGQLGGEETITLTGTPDQVRLLEIETGKTPGESAREKARILARQPEPPVVDEGLIPPQIELSPQAAALAALEEGKPTPAKSKLLAKPSQPPEGAPSTAGMLLEEPVAAPAAENLPTPPQLEVTRRASGVAVSPVIEDINFDRARRNLTSADQASFRLTVQELAPDAAVFDAIGDWVDGAENSVAAVFTYNKPIAELRRIAASAGLSRDQKAALWWTTDPDGKDAAHFIVWPKDVSIVNARQAMIDAGMENRTLVQTPDGVQGFVFDGGQQALNKIEQLHEHSTKPSIESSRATGEFIGDYSSVKRPDGGREGGRAGARQAYRDVLGTSLKTKTRENLLQSTEVGGGGKPTELGGGGVLSTPSRVDPRTSPKTGSPQPNPVIRGLADNYNTQRNLAPITHGHYVPVDESLAQQIAKAYDELPEIDRSPETLNAYQALAKEVSDQWDFAVKNLGIKFEPWVGEGQPYANSLEMVKDVRDNNHLYFFQGGDPHPFLNELDPKTGFTANDKFRAVHDLFGHASEGYQFGPRGEENAWIKHSQMFSPEARRALSTETRGQNSWVNFGTQKYEGGVNKNIQAKDRPYAVQKSALLPEELTDWNSAIARSEQSTPANQPALSPQATRRSDSLFERAREQGSVNPQLLFSTPVQSSLGAVVGGAYGSTEGDTPEERASNMLKYAGLGAAGGILTSKLGRTAMSRKVLTSGPTTEMAKHLTPVEGKPLSQVAKEIPGKLKRDWITAYAPLDKLEKDVAEANAAVVSLIPRAIPLSREFEQVAGAAGKAGQEVRDYVTNVIDQVGPKDRRAFDEIVALKRIEQRLAWNDLNKSDRKAVGDWTHQKVQADIDKWQQHLGPQRFAELEGIAVNQFQKAADDALKLQVASGRMSPEQYQAVKKENDFYAPFEVLDWLDSDANVASRPKVGTGVDTMEPLSKKITGIRNELFHIENPTVSLGKQIWKSRILADKNLKMRELADLADADVSGKYVRKLESWEEPRRGYETVNYFDDGKKMKLEVGPEVAEAVKGLSVGQTNLLSKFAKRFASTFRFGATSASVPFQPINFAFADQPMLWLVSKYGLKANPKEFIQAPADFASGMYASMFSNLLGGETGAFAKATENLPIVGEANRRAAELSRKFNESGASGAVWQDMLDSMGGTVDEKQLMKSLKIGENSVIDGVGAMNKFIEESTKLMGFKRGLRIEGIEKMAPKQAEEALKKVVTEVRNYVGSPDFQRAGREARTLNNVVQMFLNARLQGTTNLGARLSGADGAKAASEAWLRTAGSVGTGAAYLWSLNQEPENKSDYGVLSAVEKANYFHVPRYDAKGQPIYSVNDRGERSREYFRIPKREILGYFGNTVDAALNFAQDQDPEAAGKFAVQMLESLSPVNVSGKNLTERMESVVGGSNPLIKVPYETLSGRETFRHRFIVPAGDLQKASPEQQYLPTTPKLFVSAAQAMPEGAPDVLRSPLRLQQLVGGLVGPLVSQFLDKPQPEGRDVLASQLASNPLTARLVSTGYTERADEKAAVEKAETEAADVRVERRREAQDEINRIRKLPAAQRGKAILDLGAQKPEVFKALEKELRYQSEDPITRRIRGLGERDGTRARFIVNRIRELKDPQKITEFLTRLSEGPEPALTEEVMAQIEALAGAGSSPANTSPRR